LTHWRPKALYFQVGTEFVKNVRDLYRGFYLGEDRVFDEALERMGLLGARMSLRKHFGEGDQSAVSFRLKVFQNTFTEVFEVCAKEKIRLDRDFLVLGLMLLTLYENLESLDQSLDVRRSFMNASERAGLV
jgi:predicted unusual protein kinase regulating ubiquinone biosynthesis (AarF/ABC1/UbiB family)